MRVARLPFQASEPPGEMNDMLAGAAGDFEDQADCRKPFGENLGYRLAIARDRRSRPLGARQLSFVETPLSHSLLGARCAPGQ